MQHNDTIHRKNRVFAPIIVAIGIVCIILVTKPVYTHYIEQARIYQDGISRLESKKVTRDELLKIQAMFASGATTDIVKKVEKLDKKFISSDIMESVMLNDFTKTSLSTSPRIAIGTIHVDKGSALPSGLSLGQVNVQVTAENLNDIIDYITYLTTNSTYVFILDTISLPIDTAPTEALNNGNGIALSLSLGVYYYE